MLWYEISMLFHDVVYVVRDKLDFTVMVRLLTFPIFTMENVYLERHFD